MPGTNRNTALPPLFSCAVANWCTASQYAAAASHRCTCPAVTGLDPAVTPAVAVTGVPNDTVVTGVPSAVIANVGEVADPAPLVMINCNSADAVSAPEVPVTVTLELPAIAVLEAISVRVLLVVSVAGKMWPLRPQANRLR